MNINLLGKVVTGMRNDHVIFQVDTFTREEHLLRNYVAPIVTFETMLGWKLGAADLVMQVINKCPI